MINEIKSTDDKLATELSVLQWLPESVRYNVLMGKSEKAMATLARIAKDNGKPMPQGKLICYKQVRFKWQ